MDNGNGNRKRSIKGKVATKRVQMGWSRAKKRKENGTSYRENNNRGEIGEKKSDKKREKKQDAWKEKFI
jgi:hypothetical protein